jgi:hypothetical protein
MQLRDFMSHDAGDGCRGKRRNAARFNYRIANAGRVFVNSRSNPAVQTIARPEKVIDVPHVEPAEVIDAVDLEAVRRDKRNAAARARRAAAKASKLAEAA